MEDTAIFPPILEGFERLDVDGAESGEWDVPSGIVSAQDAARAVAALRLHSRLGLKRRAAIANINTLAKLNEEWPADLSAPSGPLEDLFVYAMRIAQPAAQDTGKQTAPVARARSPGHFCPAAGFQSLEQLGPMISPITAPATGSNQVALWILHDRSASISVQVNSPTIQAAAAESASAPAVSTGAPKKLTWSERQAQAKKQAEEEDTSGRAASVSSSTPAVSTGTPKKLTWIERQALAKKQDEEDEARSRAASVSSGKLAAGTGFAVGATALAAGAGIVTGVGIASGAAAVVAAVYDPQSEEEEEAAPPPPPPPLPPPQAAPQASYQEDSYDSPPLPPHPPPPPLAFASAPAAPANIQQPPPVAPAAAKAPLGRGMVAVVLYPYEAAEENEMKLIEDEQIEQIMQDSDDWWSGVGDGGAKSGLFPANHVQIIEKEPEAEAPPPPPPPAAAAAPAPAAPPAPPAPAADKGSAAIAAYDFDATEDNEISFHEGERITQIEAVSDDWWQGQNAAGQIGLFPAPYVQLEE